MTERQKIVEPVKKKIICLIQYVSHFYMTETKTVLTEVTVKPR